MDVNAKIENHETRITKLETGDAVMEERFKSVCRQLEGLVKAMWFLGTTIIVTLVGFFVWYVQTRGGTP